MIVLFGGEKGGSGKTTLAVNIASIRTGYNNDLLLIDTDKQSSASYWCGLREKNNIIPRIASIQKYGKEVRSEVIELAKKYQDIIIDAGGRDSSELRASLCVADVAIFPLRPSQFDLWTLSRLSELVEFAMTYNHNLKSFMIINQASYNPKISEVKDAQEYTKDIKNITLITQVICERISFRKSSSRGMSVVEEKTDKKSINEITNLYRKIYE